ncbi:MAG: glycosyltransferase family 39 protein [Patescibacteria group bacterium]
MNTLQRTKLLWAKLGILSGLTIAEALTTLQALSLLLSILTFLIAVPIAHLVFSKSERLEQLFFVGLLAVCPGLIFFSSRINNDVLVQFFLMFAFWRLLLFWRKSEQKNWLLASAAVALGILTKMNAVLLLPVLGLALPLKRFSSRTKLVLAAQSAFLLLAIAGWFIVLRFFIEQTNLVANAPQLHQITNLEQTWVSFLRFRPWAILQHPVIDTLNSDFPRNAFFEYYFRSMLGGTSFSGLHVLILLYLIAFFLLPVVLFGCIRTFRERSAAPLLLLLFVLIGAHLLFRAFYPYASSQDFRYTALVAIPLAYFTVQGAAHAGHLQGFLRGSIVFFIATAAAFPLALALGL